MNRRSFTASLAALFAVPAIPAVASIAPAAASQTAVTHYATAKLLARAHNYCSPAMLQRLLRVDISLAHELNRMLLQRGVISAAGVHGTSIAMNPLNTHCVPNEAMRASNFAQKARDAKAKLDRVAKALKDADDDEVEQAQDQRDEAAFEPEERPI